MADQSDTQMVPFAPDSSYAAVFELQTESPCHGSFAHYRGLWHMLAKTTGGRHAFLAPNAQMVLFLRDADLRDSTWPAYGWHLLNGGADVRHKVLSAQMVGFAKRLDLLHPDTNGTICGKATRRASRRLCANRSFSAYAPISDHGSTCANGGIKVLTVLPQMVPYEQMALLAPRRSSVHRP